MNSFFVTLLYVGCVSTIPTVRGGAFPSPNSTSLTRSLSTSFALPPRRVVPLPNATRPLPSSGSTVCDIDVLILLSTPYGSASEALSLRSAVPKVLDAVAAQYPTARFGLATFTSPYDCNEFESVDAVGSCFELIAPLQNWDSHEEIISSITSSLYGGGTSYGATWSALISSALSMEVGWRPERAIDDTRSRLILVPTAIAGNTDRQTCAVARENTPNAEYLDWPSPYPSDPYDFRAPPRWNELCRFYDRPIYTDARDILNNEKIYAAFLISEGYPTTNLAGTQLNYVIDYWGFPEYLLATYKSDDISNIVDSWTNVILSFADEAVCSHPDTTSTETVPDETVTANDRISHSDNDTSGATTEAGTEEETTIQSFPTDGEATSTSEISEDDSPSHWKSAVEETSSLTTDDLLPLTEDSSPDFDTPTLTIEDDTLTSSETTLASSVTKLTSSVTMLTRSETTSSLLASSETVLSLSAEADSTLTLPPPHSLTTEAKDDLTSSETEKDTSDLVKSSTETSTLSTTTVELSTPTGTTPAALSTPTEELSTPTGTTPTTLSTTTVELSTPTGTTATALSTPTEELSTPTGTTATALSTPTEELSTPTGTTPTTLSTTTVELSTPTGTTATESSFTNLRSTASFSSATTSGSEVLVKAASPLRVGVIVSGAAAALTVVIVSVILSYSMSARFRGSALDAEAPTTEGT